MEGRSFQGLDREMNKKYLMGIGGLLLGTAMALHSSEVDFPKLSGPYLGQKPPELTPELFAPGIISTGLDEALCAFTPKNDEIVFNLIYHKPHSAKVHSALVRSRLRGGAWTPPEVMGLSGDGYAYLYPFISYDGTSLYFQSDMPTRRPELKDKYNIWRCRRDGDGWGEPEPLPPPINGRGDVSGPSMSQAGEFFFTLMSGQPERDGIYRSQYRNGAFSEPERLPESVNVKQGSFDGVVSPDGSYYIVNVYRKEDSLGETDLYISFRDTQGVWAPLKNLGPTVNSKLNEGSARISADGRYIFFTGYFGNINIFGDHPAYDDILNSRLRPQCGNSDIYWVSAEIIETLRPKEWKKMKKE